MATPWYAYPMDSPGGGYGEILDPFCASGQCSYLKPDTNVCVPGGVPITSLGSGTVSSVKNMFGQPSVTVRLDQPLNSDATHMAYNFLGSANVSQGQRVNIGSIIGTARGGSGVCTAFALTKDESYGGQFFNLNAVGSKSLDPRPVLNAFRSGTMLPGQSASLSPQEQAKLNAQNSYSSLPFGIGDAITSLQQSFVNFTEEVAVFMIALVLIIMGIMILAGKQIGGFVEGSAKKGAEVGKVAAI